MRKHITYCLLYLCTWLCLSTLSAQVTLQVRVNSGSSGTSCTDGVFGGSPDPQWRVNIANQGWTTYPRSGACFTNPPNTQYNRTFDCPSDYPTLIQVCFRAFEDDGTACVVSEDCSETLCQTFATPAPGTSATYTLTIPNNGSNRSWGTVNFTLTASGAFSLPGASNDIICNAVNLGTLASGGSVGNAALSNYGNFCAGSTGDPQPTWANEQGVWFRFTTSAQPGAVIRVDAANDPQERGDQIDLQLALYQSSNGTCTGTLSRIASEHTIPLYSETMELQCLQPNTTYYLLVDGADNGILGGQQGFFGLQITDNGIRQGADQICQAEHLGTITAGGQVGTPTLSRSNVCATNTGDPTPPVWTADKSVWFSFNAPPSGNVVIEANSDLPAPLGTDAIDLQVAVYSTSNNLCTGTLQYVQAGYSPLGFDEELNVRCLTAGRRYWVMVDGSGINVDGIFDIQIRDGGIPPAPNDLICNAIALGQPAPNGTVGRNNQNNFCADNIFEPIPNNWGNDQGIWYSFIAPPSGKVEIRTQSQGILGDPIDLQLAVYDSDNMTCTGNLTEIKSEHEGIGVLWDEDMEVTCLIPGRMYYILVDGEGSVINPGLQEGIFDIQVYADPRDPPATNDQLCNALALGDPTGAPVGTGPVTNHGSQNNFCATSAGEPNPSGFTPRQTVWYSFVAPSTGNVNIQLFSDNVLNGIDPIDLQIAIWESSNGTCTGTMREELSGDDLLYDVDIDVYCLNAGQTYFVQIDGGGAPILGGREGYFDITISELPPVPVAPNDEICNAIALGNPFATGSVGITNQHNLCADDIGDPDPSDFDTDKTVWYTFTTPATGTSYAVNIDATSSLPWPFGNQNAIDLQLAVYASSNNTCNGTLTEIESDYDAGFFNESVTVQCLEPNRTYFVMVDGSPLDVQGYFDLQITPATSVPLPTNDNICQHTDLGTVPVGGSINNNISYFNFCASTESNEPAPFGINQTVWFSFIAPNHTGANATSNVTVRVESDGNNVGNDVDLQLAVYESSNNTCTGSLSRVGDDDPTFSFDAEVELTCLYPGRRYWVQVDGSSLDIDGYFTIEVEDDGAGIRPPYNQLCSAVALGAVPNGGSINNGVNYLNLCSDVQGGEPTPSAFAIEQTVWFTFQAPASGNVTVDLRNDPNNMGDQIDLQVAVYQAFNNSCNGGFIEIDSRYNPFGFNESLTLECLTPNALYYVQVDGASGLTGGQEGYFTIAIRDNGGTSNAPYNNDICNAYNFGTPTGITQVRNNETNECANVQFGEPGVNGYADHTVWYQFTAPTSARVRIEVESNDQLFGLDPEIYLFASSNNTCTGTLSRIESSNLPTALITESIEATCLTAGNTYFLQVDGSGLNTEGEFTIRIVDMLPNYGTGIAGDPQPINNDCAHALPLTVQSESCFDGSGTFQMFNYGQPTISLNNNFVRNCNNNCGDTWYTFTMPSTGIALLEGNDDDVGSGFPTGDFSEVTIAAYTGTCGNLTPMDCGAGGLGDDVSYELAAAPGTTVYVQVFNDNGDDDNEDFELCVSQGCGANHCLNAVAYPILPNVPYCFNTTGASGENVSGGEAGYFECGENDNPEHSVYYYFVSDCNGSDVTVNVINARSAGNCMLGTTPSDGFNISFFQDATPCDNMPDALVDCQNFNSCMPQPINWSFTYTNLLPNTPYIIQIDGGFNFLGGDNNGYIMIQTTTNPVVVPIATPVSCGSSNDGTATAIVAGGVAPFSFQWSNGTTDSIATNLSTGTYTVTITSANGCTDIGSVFVAGNPSTLIANVGGINDESCSGLCDGTATVAGSGGTITTGYLYQWDAAAGNQTTATATGLCAGTYTVTVRDNSTCIATTTININNAVALTSTIASISNATCAGCDGTATITTTGGTAPAGYHYAWTNGNATPTATGLCAGTHTVTVSDDNGCTATHTLTITQPVAITATLASQTNILCNGATTGSISIAAGGGQMPYSYAINAATPQASNAFANLSAGVYTVTVSDANGCRAFVPVTLTQPSALGATLVSSIDATCAGANDGELTVQAVAGTGVAPYQYSIDGLLFQPNGHFTNLIANNYTIIVHDANGCSLTVPATIAEPAAITVSNGGQTTASCGACDAAATAIATGGAGSLAYLWTSGETTATATALCSGGAMVTITDANGCAQTLQYTISNAAGFATTATVTQAILCAGACDAVIQANTLGGTAPYTFQWSNGATTSNATGLCAGTHTATITDASGCISTQTILLTEPTILQANATLQTSISCANGSNGTALASATGGTMPYTFLWSNQQTTQLATGLGAGTHTVTVTDAHGCTAIANTTLTNPIAMIVSASVVSASDCSVSGCTGAAIATPAGGTAPYGYAWTGGSSLPNPTNLCPNFNTVTVTDDNGCTATATVNIPANTNLNITNLIANSVRCVGGCDGSASLSATGGTAPYQYTWSNGATTAGVSGLCAGSYQVTVSDAGGCSAATMVVIGVPTAVSVTATSTNALCFNSNSGTAIANASGGTAPYNYRWSNGATTQNVTGLIAGTYRVSATDANGCSNATTTIAISQPNAITAAASVTSNYNGAQLTCPSANDGTAQAIATGGTGTLSYHWINGQTTQLATGLQASSYPVTVTDANGCTATATVSITPPTVLAITATITSVHNGYNVSCFGGNDGAAVATAAGGTGTLVYTWSGGQRGTIANNMTGGVYTVSVTDANGCMAMTSGTLTQPSAITLTTTSIQSVTCFGGNDGRATATASGSLSPYQYAWSNGSTGATVANLATGLHRVTVSDRNGCTQIATVSISQPTALAINSISTTPASCFGNNNGRATVTAVGGTQPYAYHWSNNATTQTVTGLLAGAYSVTITDANNCSITTNASISQPTNIAASITTTQIIRCAGNTNGALRAAANGGTAPYRYQWSNNATTQSITGLAAGVYSVTIADANNCTSTASATLTAPSAFSVTASIASNYNGQAISCFSAADGRLTATATGGSTPYTYWWTIGQTTQTVTGITRGIYTVVATDANGCTTTGHVSISDPTPLELSLQTTNATCYGANNGRISASVGGGTPNYTYSWDNGQRTATATGLAPTTYQVTASDANGCTMTAVATVLQPMPLHIADAGVQAEGCANHRDGMAYINGITGGTPTYNIRWSNGATTAINTGLAAGTYTVTITDRNGCTLSDTLVVPSIAPMRLAFTNVTGVQCANQRTGSATVLITGGSAPYTFRWDNGLMDSIETHLHAGYNTVTVTDIRGCTAVDSVFINNANPLAIIRTSRDISCFGANDGQASVSVSGGTQPYTYHWTTGATTATVTGLAPNVVHWVTVTDASGCSELQSFYLRQPSQIIARITLLENESCDTTNDGHITVVAAGGKPTYTFAWSNGATTFNATQSSLINLQAGIYSVTITDSNGCSVVLDTFITQPSALAAKVQTMRTSCFTATDGRIIVMPLGGTPPYLYYINNSVPTTDSIFTGLAGGIYTVGVLDANNCPFITRVTVARPDSILLVTPADMQIDMGNVVNLYVRMPINAPYNPRVTWSPSVGLSCDTCFQTTAQPFETTLYTVTVVGDDGCPSRSDVLVEVDKSRNIFVPTGFTPNNDGINDVFMVYGRDGVARIKNMLVFDRWGELVFSGKDLPINYAGVGWDGTFKGKPLNPAVFAYYIEIQYLDGVTEVIKGDVTLLR